MKVLVQCKLIELRFTKPLRINIRSLGDGISEIGFLSSFNSSVPSSKYYFLLNGLLAVASFKGLFFFFFFYFPISFYFISRTKNVGTCFANFPFYFTTSWYFFSFSFKFSFILSVITLLYEGVSFFFICNISNNML